MYNNSGKINENIRGNSMLALKIGAVMILVVFILSGLGLMMGWFGSAVKVAKKEFGPDTTLIKYEWFINASNELEKMDSDIQIYYNKQNQICVGELDIISREQCMIWSQEIAGIQSAYNGLVSEYNSNSQKFNWTSFNTQNISVSYVKK